MSGATLKLQNQALTMDQMVREESAMVKATESKYMEAIKNAAQVKE